MRYGNNHPSGKSSWSYLKYWTVTWDIAVAISDLVVVTRDANVATRDIVVAIWEELVVVVTFYVLAVTRDRYSSCW